jgi:hypothetical protein
MPETNYRDLRDAVNATDHNKDGALFHQTVDRLASILGFAKKKEWYEAETSAPDYFRNQVFNFTDPANLEECIGAGVIFKYFEHNNQYKKNNDSFTSSTLHQDWISFELDKFQSFSVTSESTLGLEYDVIPYNEFRHRFPRDDSATFLTRAFKSGCLLRMWNSYLMSPRYLLRLAEQRGILR